MIICAMIGWRQRWLFQSAPRGTLKKDWSLLVLDAFCCQRNKTLLQHLKRDHKTDVAIIPGGMTSLLQLLDVG